MDDLEKLVPILAIARKEYSDALALKKSIEEETAYQNALARVAGAKSKLAELETAARQQALDLYLASGDKKPHPALGIRIKRRLQYDPEYARLFCLNHFPSLLALDVKAFEKHALAVADTVPLPVGTVMFEPEATIQGDLSEYLPVSVESMNWEDIQEIAY